MPNIKQIITNHNAHISKPPIDPNTTLCNCRSANTCPLDGKCLTSNIVYKADNNTQTCTTFYIGLTEGTFKSRYNNHKKSFNLQKYATDTELSKHIWSLKNTNTHYTIHWSILKQIPPMKQPTQACPLCNAEKLAILSLSNPNMLNTRSEIMSKCRHQNKFYSHPSNRIKLK